MKKSAFLIATLLISLNISGCKTDNIASTITPYKVNANENNTSDIGIISTNYTEEDLQDSWDNSKSTQINLNGNSININGSGASANESILTISSTGTYVISGTLYNGQIIVDAGKNDTVHIVLNGVNITCSNNSPLYSKQADKTIITVADGSENTFSDGKTYIAEDDPDSAIFAKDDLTINGTGILKVVGQYKNGITSNDNLIITSGNINVEAIDNAIKGRDSVSIKNGNFTINSQGDGIKSNNDEDTEKGWISIDGGTFVINAANDGIQAETTLQINSGDFDITTGNGSTDKNITTNTSKNNMNRPFEQKQPETSAATSSETSISTKGLKASSEIYISNGNFVIDSLDDSIHSNSNVTIKDGKFEISSDDDAIHADSAVIIDGGNINIKKCYEGIDGANVTINNGTIFLISSDDGINAANGETSTNPSQVDSSCFIKINGGIIYIDSSGDGLDSNGNLYIDGGTVLINGSLTNGDAAIDYDEECKISGGILAAAGSSGMSQAPQSSSSQYSLKINYSSTQKAGTLINISDESGTSIFTFSPLKDYQSIVISTPNLEPNKTYSIYSGGSCDGENINGFYNNGTYSNGTKLTNITLSDITTSISDNGSIITNDRGNGGGGRGNGFGKPNENNFIEGNMPPNKQRFNEGMPKDIPNIEN